MTTDNVITGHAHYLWYPGNVYSTLTFGSNDIVLAVTANAAVTTGTAISTTNVYGLLVLALLLVGTGILVVHKPQRIAT